MRLSKTVLYNIAQVRKSANDTCFKYMVANEMKCQPEPVEGGA
jgi:hypothetical protein